jgi:hypothetical protein
VGLVGLGAKINLAALSPNAVRPTFTPKKEAPAEEENEEGSAAKSKVTFSANENGEIKHVS